MLFLSFNQSLCFQQDRSTLTPEQKLCFGFIKTVLPQEQHTRGERSVCFSISREKGLPQGLTSVGAACSSEVHLHSASAACSVKLHPLGSPTTLSARALLDPPTFPGTFCHFPATFPATSSSPVAPSCPCSPLRQTASAGHTATAWQLPPDSPARALAWLDRHTNHKATERNL